MVLDISSELKAMRARMAQTTTSKTSRRASIMKLLKRSSKSQAYTNPDAVVLAPSKVEAATGSYHDAATSRRDTGRPGPRNHTLSSLPTELQIQIIKHLELSDLYALRLTSRQIYDNVSHGDIPKEFMFGSLPQHTYRPRQSRSTRAKELELYMKLYPVPVPFRFTYILDQCRRIRAACLLAREIDWYIGNYVLMNPHLWPSTSGASWFQAFPIDLLPPEYGMVRKRMVLPLLTIQHYLEHLRDHLIAPSTETAQHVLLRSAAYSDLRQLNRSHKMFMVLCWLTKRLFDPAGHRARRIVVLSKSGLSDESVRKYLIFSNLRGLELLLREDSYKHRKKMVQSLLRDLTPSHAQLSHSNWRKAWLQVSNHYDWMPDHTGAARAMSAHVEWHEVWIDAARTILMNAGRIEKTQPTTVPFNATRRTLEWTTDVAGYHGCQGRGIAAGVGTGTAAQPMHGDEVFEDLDSDDDSTASSGNPRDLEELVLMIS